MRRRQRAAAGFAVVLLLGSTSACESQGSDMTCADVQIDLETQRCSDGPTPAGGAYSIGTYLDEERNPVPKDQATHLEIIEYDSSGNSIHQTFGTL